MIFSELPELLTAMASPAQLIFNLLGEDVLIAIVIAITCQERRLVKVIFEVGSAKTNYMARHCGTPTTNDVERFFGTYQIA